MKSLSVQSSLIILLFILFILCLSLLKLVEPFDNPSVQQMNEKYQSDIVDLNKNSDEMDTSTQDLINKQIPTLKKTNDKSAEDLAHYKDGYASKIDSAKQQIFQKMDTDVTKCLEQQKSYVSDKSRFDGEVGKVNGEMTGMTIDMPNAFAMLKDARDQNALVQDKYDALVAIYNKLCSTAGESKVTGEKLVSGGAFAGMSGVNGVSAN